MENVTTKTELLRIGLTGEETLFFRLSSAIEGITLYIILCQILPTLYLKRSFYLRLAATYLLIVVILTVRFYDFLETNIFRSLDASVKIRFLLYCVGPLECIFDLSLVSLSVETILNITSAYVAEAKLWTLYIIFTVGIPAAFLLLMVVVWETNHKFKGILATAMIESTLPAVGTFVLLALLYWLARKNSGRLSEEQVYKAKLMVSVSVCEGLGVSVNLILYLIKAELVMNDVMDSLMKLGVCWSYILVKPGSWTEKHLLTSLNQPEGQFIQSAFPHTPLREARRLSTASASSGRSGRGDRRNSLSTNSIPE